MRVLGSIRESRSYDASTSPSVQEEKIRGWAALHDAQIVDIAHDADVSGKRTSPFERPSLGPWLKDHNIHRWDALVVSRLDRLCRNATEFFRMISWAQEHDKALVFIREGFDLTNKAGQLAAKLIAVVAEHDWENIRDNTMAGSRKALSQGRWRGGIAPYGYRPVVETRNGVQGTYLEIDPETSAVVREIVNRVISGRETLSGIARDLNRRGIPSPNDAHRIRMGKKPKGTKWWATNLPYLLRSRALLGEYGEKDKVLYRDESGLPLAKADPLISRAKFVELQSALDKIQPRNSGRREGGALLYDVLMCGVCGRKMYLNRRSGGKAGYYRCSSYKTERCENRSVPALDIEREIESSFMAAFGEEPMVRVETVPGEDWSEEISILEEEIANLSGNLARVSPGSIAAEKTLELLAERERLLKDYRSRPSRGPETRYVPTGQTMGDAWKEMEDQGEFLRQNGVKAAVQWTRDSDDPAPSLVVFWGRLDDIRRAMAERASA